MTQRCRLVFCVVALVCLSFVAATREISAAGADECSRFFVLKEWNRPFFENKRSAFLSAAEDLFRSGDTQSACDCLKNAADIEVSLGNSEEAVRLLHRTLAKEQAARRDSVAGTFATLALLHHRGGSKGLSDKYLKEALAGVDKIADQDRRANTHNTLGDVFYSRQQIDRLVIHYRKADELFKSTGNRVGEAKILLNLSYAEMVIDDLPAALASASRSYEIRKEMGDVRGMAIALVALSRVSFRSGSIRDSLRYSNQATELFPTDLDLTEQAPLIYGASELYDHLGDCEQASIGYRKVLEILKADGNTASSIGTLWNLASADTDCGRYAEAETTLASAIGLARSLGRNDDLAFASLKLGEVQAATNRLESALDTLRYAARLSGLTNYNKARIEAGIGEVLIRLGDFSAARVHLESALKLNREIGHKIPIGDNLRHLAAIALAEGRQDDALRFAEESVASTESISTALDNKRLRTRFFSLSDDRYETLLLARNANGHLNDPTNPEKGLDIAEASRARQLRSAIFSSDNGGDVSVELSEATEIRAQLSARSDALADLLSHGGDAQGVRSIEDEIVQLENKLESLLVKHIDPGARNSHPFSLAEFQRETLENDDLLLAFSFNAGESYLWAVGKDELEAFVLPAEAEIDSLIDEVRELITARRPRPNEPFTDRQSRIALADESYVDLTRRLSRILIGQVADKLAGKRLIVVPDGELHYLPLSALPLPNSTSDEPILLTNEVVYQPSAHAYALLKKHRRTSESNNAKDLLVFFDPVFSSSDPRLGVSAQPSNELFGSNSGRFRLVESFGSLTRLPATESEAKAVIETIGGRYEGFSGFDATRERLLSLNLADYRIVHLATHGKTDIQRPELSSLIFSRFDSEGQPLNEAIRLQDIYSMRLAADIVVLSACETGTGKEIKGEGVLGLGTAFLQSGARSVVSSQWVVEDNAANLLMKNFYSAMVNDGTAPAAALRAAQIKLYQDPQYRSPFYWAAFTIQGDAGAPLKFTDDRSYQTPLLITAALAVLLTAFAVARMRRQRTSKT